MTAIESCPEAQHQQRQATLLNAATVAASHHRHNQTGRAPAAQIQKNGLRSGLGLFPPKAKPRTHACSALAAPGNYSQRIMCVAVFNPSFESAISTTRLSTYRRVTRSDDHAWALYRWNLDLVAGFGPLASDTEVALRNTIHDQLSTHFGRPDWWASPALILDDTTTDVLTRRERPSTQGNCSGGSTTLRARLGLMGG